MSKVELKITVSIVHFSVLDRLTRVEALGMINHDGWMIDAGD